MNELNDNLLTSILVKFIYKDSIFIHKTPLGEGDIRYIQIYDLDYLWKGRVEKITEFIQIWKGEAFTLLKPLLLIKIPRVIWFERREFADFMNEEVEKKKFYLKRLGNKLENEIKIYLESNSVDVNGKDFRSSNMTWVKIPKKWVWLADLLSKPSDENNPEKEE